MAIDWTLDPDLWVYTNQDDTIDFIIPDTVQLGLRGDDHFYVNGNTDHRILLGGIGDDTYTVYGGAIIFDFDGYNVIEMPETSFFEYYVATISNGYGAVIYDYTTKDYVIFVDIENEKYWDDVIYFEEEALSLGYLFENIYEDPLYLGDVPWYHLGTLGLEPLLSGDAIDAINFGIVEQSYWQSRADVEYIALVYEAALDRAPDVPGLNFWVDTFESGVELKAIATQFLYSDEFRDNFGDVQSMSTEELVSVMYQNVLGREADRQGYDFWVDKVNEDSITKADILVYFSTSNENFNQAGYLEDLYEIYPGNWTFIDVG